MKPTWKVILLIMLAGFVGWRVMAQEPQASRPSSGQPYDPNGLSGGQQSNPAAQTNSGVPISGAVTLTPGAGRGGETDGTVKGGADVSDLTITAVPLTTDELSMMLEKARQIASEMESASIHRANNARNSMQPWNPIDVEGRDRLRKELRLFVMRAFEARHALQRMEVALLEKKLQAMNRKLEEQETKASEIIERRIDDLLNPNLRWDDSAIKNSATGRPLAFDGIRALTASEAASITAQNHSPGEAASELSKRITECMESLIRLRGLQQKAASKGSNSEHLATQIKDEEQRLRNLMGLPNIDGQRIIPSSER